MRYCRNFVFDPWVSYLVALRNIEIHSKRLFLLNYTVFKIILLIRIVLNSSIWGICIVFF
jgi:hypothetical protein